MSNIAATYSLNDAAMSNTGPVIIVEDDVDDREVLSEVFQSLALPYGLLFFNEGGAALQYLKATPVQPFMIITDVNLPGMDGLQLREAILKDDGLRQKSIPFIFLSTSDGTSILDKVYQLQVQGYFQKEHSFKAIQNQINLIVQYWKVCRHPNNR